MAKTITQIIGVILFIIGLILVVLSIIPTALGHGDPLLAGVCFLGCLAALGVAGVV